MFDPNKQRNGRMYRVRVESRVMCVMACAWLMRDHKLRPNDSKYGVRTARWTIMRDGLALG